MKEKILFVDDEPKLLKGIERQLHRDFHVVTALGGPSGLKAIKEQGPFFVVVSDYRMPEMNGVDFLKAVQELSPDAVRVMLTGNADIDTAVQAVNEGNIFRFLTKPCPKVLLAKVMKAACEQHRLVTAERELLEKTLHASVKVLTDTLSLLNPLAFSRGGRIRPYVRYMAETLGLPSPWQYELAGMLSQIGCMTIPPGVLKKFYAQQPLARNELEMYYAHPEVGHKLLANIPRLEGVAAMIAWQLRPFSEFPKDSTAANDDARAALGAQILHAALALDDLLMKETPFSLAVGQLRLKPAKYNPKIVAVLKTFKDEKEKQSTIQEITMEEIAIGMVALEDIQLTNGVVAVPKGETISYPLHVRLKNYAKGVGVKEPIRVKAFG